VQSADAVIAVGGKYGTLSEIAIALKLKKPVFGYRTWDIDGVFVCATPEEAVVMAVRAARLSLSYRNPPDAKGSP
jgi:predicted Rossmann-fold nucleotide-binding protein